MPAMEVLPPDFDSTKKYPVLFHVYGGPGSQLVSYQFALDWHTFVASQLGFIVVTVDGRGTGYQGREYRSVVRGKLGEYETVDQVNAAKHWAGLDYVDPARIAIWGWVRYTPIGIIPIWFTNAISILYSPTEDI
jgi:dipeptidyl aminopeptidase/acylaminoacyl peptidase